MRKCNMQAAYYSEIHYAQFDGSIEATGSDFSGIYN